VVVVGLSALISERAREGQYLGRTTYMQAESIATSRGQQSLSFSFRKESSV
jgi:hypothetical protein